MPVKLLMPKIGLNMVEGQINAWVAKEGQKVSKGDVLYVVETDKVTNDVEAPQDGVLAKILVPEGKVVPTREVVGVLIKEGEEIDLENLLAEYKKSNQLEAGKEQAPKKTSAEQKSVRKFNSTEVLASPLAKRLAAQHQIDLAEISGSGPGGRIKNEDVEKIIAERSKRTSGSDLPGKIVPLKGVRKITAERTAQAWREIPMVTLQAEIDVTQLVLYRENLKKELEKNDVPSINTILTYLTARALKEFPYLNASLAEAGINLIEPINIGIAVDTADGLTVVVIPNSDKKPIAEIHKELTALTSRAIARKSKPEDLQAGTFTITNLGMFGVDGFTPIINPPQAGILGIGRFVKKEEKDLAVFSLVFDHRVIDGAPAAKFLQKLSELIQQLTT